jgi:hypothetical protein
LALLALFVAMMSEAVEWNPLARVVPLIVGSGAVLCAALALANEVFKKSPQKCRNLADEAKAQVQQKMHMDIKSSISHLPVRTLLTRGAMFYGWMVAFLISMAVIGIIPTVPLFVIAFMRIEAREKWRVAVPMAAVMCVFIYYLFDQLLAIPWPPTVLADYFPDAVEPIKDATVAIAAVIAALTASVLVFGLLRKLAANGWAERKPAGS